MKLLMDGATALADVEAAGIRIDVDYLDRAIAWTGQKIKRMEAELRADDVFQHWRREFGAWADLGSRQQLGKVVYGCLGEHAMYSTATGRTSTAAEALAEVDHPFVRRWLSFEALKKLRSTSLLGVRRQVVDGCLHANYSLHLAKTLRSVSSDPNFQNFPIRDPKQAKIIRRAFVPRPGRVLLEIDSSQSEVRCACAYHHDPVMIRYIEDEFDLHRDMAAELFLMEPEDVTKQVRRVAKSYFTFAAFYGDWWPSIAANLWRAVEAERLQTADGRLLRDHLTEQGIEELGSLEPKPGPVAGTFAAHVKRVEDHFWGERFRAYARWKRDWWEQYLRRGCYEMLTGFVVPGVFRRNEVINGPIQGTAFHWLLWTLIETNRRLRGGGLKTLIVGQIHDSMLLDVPRSELQDVVAIVQDVAVVALPKHWPWINVPLAVEASVCERNWYEKEDLAMEAA